MKEDNKSINWLDLILIGLSLFVANVIENLLQIENKILSFAAFVGISIVLILLVYLMKYMMRSKD